MFQNTMRVVAAAVAVCAGLSLCSTAKAQSAPNLASQMTEKLRGFSSMLRLPILAEGYPTAFAPAAGQNMRENSLEKVAAQYGYLVERRPDCVLLRKDYTRENDLPAVSVEELRECVRRAAKGVRAFFPARFAEEFASPDPKTGRTLRSPPARVTLRIHALMQKETSLVKDADGCIPIANLPGEVRSLIAGAWMFNAVGDAFIMIRLAEGFLDGADTALLSDLPNGEILVQLKNGRRSVVRALPSDNNTLQPLTAPATTLGDFYQLLSASSAPPLVQIDATVLQKPLISVGVTDDNKVAALRGAMLIFGLSAPGDGERRTLRMRDVPPLRTVKDLPLLTQYVPLPIVRYQQASNPPNLQGAAKRIIQRLWKQGKKTRQSTNDEPVPLRDLSVEMRTALALYITADAYEQMQGMRGTNYDFPEKLPKARFRLEEYTSEKGERMLHFEIKPPLGESVPVSYFGISQVRIESQ